MDFARTAHGGAPGRARNPIESTTCRAGRASQQGGRIARAAIRKIAVMRFEALSACSKDGSIYLMVLRKGNEKFGKCVY
ncbi:hypothetical protein [Burkholderia sp. PU8-34]